MLMRLFIESILVLLLSVMYSVFIVGFVIIGVG